MEQFVLGIFQEQLSKFIVGFRKEQVNANLLNGKGEIRDVELSCEFLNEMSSKLSPLIEFQSVHVSKVSFYVSSWTNIRKAPILIDIEHVSAELVEPLHFLDESQGRKEPQQITRQQLVHLIQQGIIKTRGAYNLFDRILDNLTIEVSSVHVSFQPCGRFKTRRRGPWTPPAILVRLANIRLVSVDEYGQEAPPEEVWKHNTHQQRRMAHHEDSLFLYKKCEMEYKISIQPSDGTNRIPLVTSKENKVELQVAIQRCIRDGEILSVQLDVTIPNVEMDLPQEALPQVAHAAAGLTYLVAKDREFVDPLRPEHEHSVDHRSSSVPTVVLDTFIDEADETKLQNTITTHGQTNIEVNIEERSVSSEEEGDESVDQEASAALSAAAALMDGSKATTPQHQQQEKLTDARYALPSAVKNQPVIIMPNGLVIHEKISISVSIYDSIIRGIYGGGSSDVDTASSSVSSSTPQYQSNRNGCFELISKGCIVEAIWPKTTKEKGGYIQASVSYFTLTEKYHQQHKPLLSGGVEFSSLHNPVEQPSKPLSEVGRDETFPLYEDRVVRPDPLGLRHSFPAQAFGLKTTVEFVSKQQGVDGGLAADKTSETASQSSMAGASVYMEDIQVLHEVGIDQVELVVESQSWCRILSFLVNEQGGGFDPRWHSGNWSSKLKQNMLVNPSLPLNLDECLQPTKQIFLDDNEFVSSDLFNMTARLTRIETRIPACIQADVKSVDIIMTLDETMFLVSSALPRTMLSGRIGNSVNGDSRSADSKGVISFPNDVSDVAYALERAEDPSNRQRGIATSQPISTFRAQVTLRGLSVRLKPAIDFYTEHNQPLLAPCEITVIFCFEGEPPETPDENLIKLVIFLSILVQRYEINADLDLLAAALSTALYHATALKSHAETLADIIQRSTREEVTELDDASESVTAMSEEVSERAGAFEGRIPKSLRGRRVLVQKQLNKSRESGGISLAVGIQMTGFIFRLWRQHVLISSADDKQRVVPAVNLIDCRITDLELGFEASLKQDERRGVLKGCLSTLKVDACDFIKLQALEQITNLQPNDETGRPVIIISPPDYLVNLVRLNDRIDKAERTADYAFAFRLEEQMQDDHRRWALATDLANTSIFRFRPEVSETLAVQLFEALLMQYDPNPADYLIPRRPSVFPKGSVGTVLLVVIPSALDTGAAPSLDLEAIMRSSAVASDGLAPGEQVEAFLQRIIDQFVPENVDVILFRSSVENVAVVVSFDDTKKNYSSGERIYSFQLHHSDFVVAYFLFGKEPSGREIEILQTVARKAETWKQLLGDRCYEKGLYHRLQSRQSISSQDVENGSITVDENSGRYFVSPFNFAYAYAQAKAHLEINPFLEICVVEKFDDFVHNIKKFAVRFRQMLDTMKMIIASVQLQAKTGVSSTEGEEPSSESSIVEHNPVELACAKCAVCVRDARQTINQIHEQLQTHGNAVGILFAKMQNYMDLLRFEAFQKEKDRLAALAIASSQVTGWLRIGAPARTGQRGTITATLWPFWAVLRKGIILVYSGPGKTRVLDLISLQGAALYQLGGGQRKRDLKRAFGLVQKNGMVNLITIPTDREYHEWIYQMKRSILAYAATGDGPARVPLSLPSELGAPTDITAEQDDSFPATAREPSNPTHAGQTQAQQGRLGRSIARVVQTAKATKQVVVDRTSNIRRSESQDTPDQPSPCEVSGHLNPDAPGLRVASKQQHTTVSVDVANSANSAATDFLESVDDFSSRGALTETNRRGAAFRNRLAGAKSRFGTAVQKARDNRQQRRTQVDPQQSISMAQSQIPQEQWQCPKCTFLNHPSNDQCEMCEHKKGASVAALPTPLIVRTASSADVSGAGSDFSNEPHSRQGSSHLSLSEDGGGAGGGESTDDPGAPRAGMRARIAATVARARGNQRQQQPNKSTDGAPGTVKMRDVVLVEPLDTSKDPFGEEQTFMEEIVKRLDGHWFVRVRILRHAADFGSVTESQEPETTAKSEWISSAPAAGDTLASDAINLQPTYGKNSNYLLSAVPTTTAGQAAANINPDTASAAQPGLVAISPLSAVGIDVDVANAGAGVEMGAVPPLMAVVATVPAKPGTHEPSLPCAKAEKPLVSSLQIDIYQEHGPKTPSSPYAQVIREFSDVFSLHTTISECVGRLPPPASYAKRIEPRDDQGTLSSSLAQTLGLTALEAVRTTARLLSGLLEDGAGPAGTAIQLTEYHADVVAEFLNSMIDTELPIDGLLALTEFLELTGVSTKMLLNADQRPRGEYRSQMERELKKIRSGLLGMYKLAQVVQTDMVQAELNSLMAQRIAQTNPPSDRTGATPTPGLQHAPAPFLSSRLHNAVHDALMKVMEERDQSRAKYAASQVLHVHELEQQRKKYTRLERELAVARRSPEHSKDITKQLQMQTDNDDELMSLCQQLSDEIGARTNATLEIDRLKEIRETERANEAAEKEALNEEIRLLKQQLERERNAAESARDSSSNWQRSFENIIEFREEKSLS